MNIVILDGETITRDDLTWKSFEEFGKVMIYGRTAPEKIVSRIREADVVLTSKCPIDKKVIDLSPDLKYIGILATGYNNIDLDYAKEKGIAVTNIPAYSTDSVAQFTFAILLELMNHVGAHDEAVKGGEWSKVPDFCFTVTPQIELSDKVFGIVGYGNIGKKVAKIAEVFCKKVIVHSPSRKRGASLDDVLEKSDIISLHCRLNEETQGMINRESIAKMKDGVVILNLARGGLVVEDDLADALKSGKVGAAGLDVLSEEPPRKGSPLIGAPNCIVTPHIAWATREARRRLLEISIKNLVSFNTGKKQNRIV